MKNFIAITAVSIAALTGVAHANTNPTAEIRGYGVETQALDNATIQALNSAIHGGGSESEKAQVVRSILLQAGR